VEAFEEALATQAKGPRFERGDPSATLARPSASPLSSSMQRSSRERASPHADSHANASGSQTPISDGYTRYGKSAPRADDPPLAAQNANGPIPVNPLLKHLDSSSAPHANGHHLITPEILQRSARDPYWRR
jgi:hypothetical protein